MYFTARFNADGTLYNHTVDRDKPYIASIDLAQKYAQDIATFYLEQVTLLSGDTFDTALAVGDYMPRVVVEVEPYLTDRECYDCGCQLWSDNDEDWCPDCF